MTYEWQRTLLDEEDLAKRAAATVPRMLAHPAVTFDQLSRLSGHIDDCIARLGRLITDLEIAGTDQAWIHVAKAIHRLWRSLALDAAERVRSFETASLDVRNASTER
ncbi:hypothetical protein [Sinorhizobium sp. BJ1]|uniref:hypothetical protein n=1 Tax=Sinorhizobium sp. BJ1 TaxID=2035455 RepID=UPI000BEA4956|nr:hypothetical protein [Sinorhizobium sp. BJ1]PDT80531.1 hypothetical protein CO676_27150 [Sinorhizobium sp. BJ1]